LADFMETTRKPQDQERDAGGGELRQIGRKWTEQEILFPRDGQDKKTAKIKGRNAILGKRKTKCAKPSELSGGVNSGRS